MVNWYWKHKVGEVVYFDLEHKQSFKVEMFGGNMMSAFIYRFTTTNKETGKREKRYNFISFLNDMKHAKKCFEDTRLEDLLLGDFKVKKVRLCVSSSEYKYSNQEMLKLGQLLAKMKYKVELY